jgi:DNA-binding MarR family transcriptional regulator
MFMADQLARNRLGKALPKGMELSHFSVLNQLARSNEEKTPAQLARIFHVTRGAMTNTLGRLEWAGHIHVRPDWDDARRKLVAISPAGRARGTRRSPPSRRFCPIRQRDRCRPRAPGPAGDPRNALRLEETAAAERQAGLVEAVT